MSTTSCFDTCIMIPVTNISSRPLDDREMPTFSCSRTGNTVTVGASILPRPFQDGEVSTMRCSGTRITIPFTAILPEPLQGAKLSILCSTFACLYISTIDLGIPNAVSSHVDEPIPSLPRGHIQLHSTRKQTCLHSHKHCLLRILDKVLHEKWKR